MHTRNLSLLLLVGTLLILPPRLDALQAPPPPIPGSAAAVQQSQQLEREVEVKLHSAEWGSRGLRKMADKLERAAELRDAEDPQALSILDLAAALAYTGGDLRHARRLLEALSDRALDSGDVMSAAHGLTRAAWVAHEQGDGSAVLSYASRAMRLSHSPLLTPVQRQQIGKAFSGHLLVAQRVR
jgi:hypothetical protein